MLQAIGGGTIVGVQERENLAEIMHVRFTPGERTLLEREAAERGSTVSQLLRDMTRACLDPDTRHGKGFGVFLTARKMRAVQVKVAAGFALLMTAVGVFTLGIAGGHIPIV